jgi:hypothetical protein
VLYVVQVRQLVRADRELPWEGARA